MELRHPPPAWCATSAWLALCLGCAAAQAAVAPDALGPAPTIRVLPGVIGLSWPASAGAQAYQVLRCPVHREAGGFTLSCPDAATDGCTSLGTTLETNFSESPPKAKAFCYRIAACEDAQGSTCTAPTAGVIGFHKPPHKVVLTVSVPVQVRPGDAVVMRSSAVSAGTVTEFRWAQEGGKDILPDVVVEPDAHWVAPAVTQITTLQFRAMVEDDYGTRDFKSVKVVVVPDGMAWAPQPAPSPRGWSLLQWVRDYRK